jgi:hypothetical protein
MYRWVLETVPEGIWVVDPQGHTMFSNAAWQNFPESISSRCPTSRAFDAFFQMSCPMRSAISPVRLRATAGHSIFA